MFQNYKALKKNLQENQMLKEIRINKKEEKIQKLKKKRIMLQVIMEVMMKEAIKIHIGISILIEE